MLQSTTFVSRSFRTSTFSWSAAICSAVIFHLSWIVTSHFLLLINSWTALFQEEQYIILDKIHATSMKFTHPMHPIAAARCRGVLPSRFGRTQFAPFVSRRLTAPTQLCLAAMCRGVLPELSVHERYFTAFGIVRRILIVGKRQRKCNSKWYWFYYKYLHVVSTSC